jgi:hypothetical protein
MLACATVALTIVMLPQRAPPYPRDKWRKADCRSQKTGAGHNFELKNI